MKQISDKEREQIITLIKEGKSLPHIHRICGKSDSTIRRVALKGGLTIVKKECKSDTKAVKDPFDESDKQVYSQAKQFILSESKAHMNEILITGKTLLQKFQGESREFDSVLDLCERSVEFYLEESLMVHSYKLAIRKKNLLIETLQNNLEKNNYLREYLRGLSMDLMSKDIKIDYESLMASVQALGTVINKTGGEEIGQQEDYGVSSGPGDEQRSVVEESVGSRPDTTTHRNLEPEPTE